MNCGVCREMDADSVCSRCGKPICSDCADPIGCSSCGGVLCMDCSDSSDKCGPGDKCKLKPTE